MPGEFVDLATLLPNSMFLGTTGIETSKPLTVQLTPVGNDLSVRPQPFAKKDKFLCIMDGGMEYISCHPH